MIKKVSAFYCLFMGISMIGIWIMFYFAGSIPEIETKPVELGFHITSEIITAIVLITGGIGLIKKKNWSFEIYLVAIGMLLYTLIMSPGYFAQKGDLAFVSMFILFIIATLILLSLSLREKSQFKT